MIQMNKRAVWCLTSCWFEAHDPPNAPKKKRSSTKYCSCDGLKSKILVVRMCSLSVISHLTSRLMFSCRPSSGALLSHGRYEGRNLSFHPSFASSRISNWRLLILLFYVPQKHYYGTWRSVVTISNSFLESWSQAECQVFLELTLSTVRPAVCYRVACVSLMHCHVKSIEATRSALGYEQYVGLVINRAFNTSGGPSRGSFESCRFLTY